MNFSGGLPAGKRATLPTASRGAAITFLRGSNPLVGYRMTLAAIATVVTGSVRPAANFSSVILLATLIDPPPMRHMPQFSQRPLAISCAVLTGVFLVCANARAAPDGYTLFFVSSSFSMQPSATPNLPYDIQRDFTPVTLAVSSPYVLVLHPSVGARDVKELIALAKAWPGQLSSATAGPGSAIQGTAELFNTMAGVNILLVPYKGAVGITDLISGQVHMSFAGFAQTMPHRRVA